MHSMVRNLLYSHIASCPVLALRCVIIVVLFAMIEIMQGHGAYQILVESAHGRKIAEDTCGHWLLNPQCI